jgi:hypothetical protein
MATTRRFYDAELSSAIARHIWNELKVTQGLKSSNPGTQFNLQGPEPLGTYLPAVRVAFDGVEVVKNRPRSGADCIYRFTAHYLRMLGDTEDIETVTRPATAAIARLFIAEEKWTLDTWTAQTGAMFRAVYTTGFSIEENGPLEELEVGIGHGMVEIMAEVDSNLYTA